MGKNIIHDALENLDGYLISIKRNIDSGFYELEVGFRKGWVFKSTEDIDCKVVNESDAGSLLIISGKHDEITVDNLIEYVNKVIRTNRKITEMQEEFKMEMEKRKEEMANRLLEIEDELGRDIEGKKTDSNKKIKKETKKTTEKSSEMSIEDEIVAQKIS